MKNNKKYLIVISVLIVLLMTGASYASAVSIGLSDKTTDDNLIQSMGKAKQIVKYGWDGRLRAEEDWYEWTDGPSGDGAQCYKISLWPVESKNIYYKFNLTEWDITADFGNLEIYVYFDADTAGINGGPDLYVSDRDSNYKLVKQGIGSPDGMDTVDFFVDNDGNYLSDYVDDNGEIYFYILNAWGCNSFIEKLTLKWIINNYKPTAVISGPDNVVRGTEVAYSASGSSDPDGDKIDGYEWKVDGTDAGNTQKIYTRFTSGGTHTVSLKVKDERGAWSPETSLKVTVGENEKPHMKSISPTKGRSRQDITFTFKASDANFDDVKFGVIWDYDPDDPDDIEWTTSYFHADENGVISTGDSGPTHEYTLSGDYKIWVIAKDIKGAESDPLTLTYTAPYSKSFANPIFAKLLQGSPVLNKLLMLLS